MQTQRVSNYRGETDVDKLHRLVAPTNIDETISAIRQTYNVPVKDIELLPTVSVGLINDVLPKDILVIDVECELVYRDTTIGDFSTL